MTESTPGALSAKEKLAKQLAERRLGQASSGMESTQLNPSGRGTTEPPSSSGTTQTASERPSPISKTPASEQVPAPTTGETTTSSSPVEKARMIIKVMSNGGLLFEAVNVRQISMGILQSAARRLPRYIMEIANKERNRARRERAEAEGR